jgi:hypothetical protein
MLSEWTACLRLAVAILTIGGAPGPIV